MHVMASSHALLDRYDSNLCDYPFTSKGREKEISDSPS